MKLARRGRQWGRGLVVVALGAAAASIVAGCAQDADGEAVTDEPAVTSSTEEELRVSDLTDYLLARPDYRRCAAPVCGGFWVRQINKERTRCADGTEQAECYVAHLDGEGMSDAVTGDHVIVRGTLGTSTVHAGYGKVDAREIWVAASGSQPTGVAYKLEPTNIRCVRAPCATWIAGRLNATTGLYFSSLGSAFSGDTSSAMVSGHALVFGGFQRTSDGGVGLTAAAAYRRAAALSTGPSACTTDAECTMTAHAKTVAQSSECGCPMCPSYPATTTEANARSSAYAALCQTRQRTCPIAKCAAPRPVACVRGACVAELTAAGPTGPSGSLRRRSRHRAGSARRPWVPWGPPGERAAAPPGPQPGSGSREIRRGAHGGFPELISRGAHAPLRLGVWGSGAPPQTPGDSRTASGARATPEPWRSEPLGPPGPVEGDKVTLGPLGSAPGPRVTRTRPSRDKHPARVARTRPSRAQLP